MVLDRQAACFLGKRWFGPEIQLLPRKNLEKKNKRKKLGNYAAKVQKDVFFGAFPRFPKRCCFGLFGFFLGNNWPFGPRTFLFLGKVSISFLNQGFPSKECLFHLFFCVRQELVLPIMFQCHYYGDSIAACRGLVYVPCVCVCAYNYIYIYIYICVYIYI